jgi:ABC-type phosphate transport system permease subunit
MRLNFLVQPDIAGGESDEGIRMIRGFFRLIGLLLLAGGFVFLVYDGARSIADQALRLTRLGEFWNDINQASQRSFQVMVDGNAPFLSGLLKLLLNQPAWAVMGVLGIVLMLLFRPSKPLIGYSRN